MITKKHIYISYCLLASATIISSSAYMIKTGIELDKQYQKTKTWQRDDTKALATYSPKLLYATKQEREKIANYQSLESAIWDQSKGLIKPNTTEERMNELTKRYNTLGDKLQKYTPNYQEIKNTWDAQDALQALVSNKTVPKSIKLSTIQKTIPEIFIKIEPYLNDELKPHQTSHEIYKAITEFSTEANKYANILDILAQNFNQSGNTFSTDMLQEHYDYLINQLNTLDYKWTYIDSVIRPLIQTAGSAVNTNNKALELYNNYIEDQKQKEAFETYKKEFINIEKELKASIIDYKDFTNKSLKDIQEWADKNNITLNIVSRETTDKENKILEQTPSIDEYTKIVKGSIITIVISKKPESKPTNTSSSTNSSNSNTTSTSSSTQTESTDPTTQPEGGFRLE